MANLALSHPAAPRSTALSGATIFIATISVAWFALVAVIGARGGFVTPPGVPPLPILLGFLTPLVVFLAAYSLSRPIREFVQSIDPRLMMAMQAWRFAGLGFLARNSRASSGVRNYLRGGGAPLKFAVTYVSARGLALNRVFITRYQSGGTRARSSSPG
jgi:hypothetical protein